MNEIDVHRGIVYLMRGLPSCGKSYTASKLAGKTGLVFETDEFFCSQVGSDPNSYDYDSARLTEARDWNFERYKSAINKAINPIVVDRGNGLNLETKRYARYAIDRHYSVELAEPESEWWQEIRVLLKYKEHTAEILDDWADRLAEKNRATHRAPSSTIRRWMRKWRHDLTVAQILSYEESASTTTGGG